MRDYDQIFYQDLIVSHISYLPDYTPIAQTIPHPESGEGIVWACEYSGSSQTTPGV